MGIWVNANILLGDDLVAFCRWNQNCGGHWRENSCMHAANNIYIYYSLRLVLWEQLGIIMWHCCWPCYGTVCRGFFCVLCLLPNKKGMSLLMVLVDGIPTCWCMRLQWRTEDFYCTSVAPLNAHHHHQQYHQSIINIFIRLLFRILAPAAAVLDQNACSLINPLLGACGKKKYYSLKLWLIFFFMILRAMV